MTVAIRMPVGYSFATDVVVLVGVMLGVLGTRACALTTISSPSSTSLMNQSSEKDAPLSVITTNGSRRALYETESVTMAEPTSS